MPHTSPRRTRSGGQDTVTPEDSDEPLTPPAEPYSRHVRDDESTSVAVVRTTAALLNTPVTELDPLGEWIDPDALDELLACGNEATVEFEYVGRRVAVTSRSVTVRDAAEE